MLPLVALPLDSVTELPKSEPSTLNCTVPLGVPLPGEFAVTVAVKWTDCPLTEGFADELTAVAVSSAFTACDTAELLLVLKLPSPPYDAVIECDAVLNALVVYVATPPLIVPVPKVVAPSEKVTVPEGEPAPGEVAVTVAVKVTD